MSEANIHRTLTTLLRELLEGARTDAAYTLNPGDQGLLRSLDQLSAAAASAPGPGGSPSIAAHVDHLRYGMNLLNRWSQGENPFEDARYADSWKRQVVSEQEWASLRERFRAETLAWMEAVKQPRALDHVTMTGMVAGVVHLAYHFGAIRQVDRSVRGPEAKD